MDDIDVFIQFEEKNKLLDDKINEYSYWSRIRYDIFQEIQAKHRGISIAEPAVLTDKKKDTFITSFKRKAKKLRWLITRNPFRIKYRCDVLFVNHERRFFIEGKYQPIYFEDILENTNLKFSLIEPSNLEESHYENITFDDRTCYFDALYYATRHVKKDKNLVEAEAKLERTLKELDDLYGIKLNHDYYIDLALRGEKAYRIRKVLLRIMLKRMKPQKIVEVVAYNDLYMDLNETAHEQGIPVYELQHGAMGMTHLAYNYGKKYNYPYLPSKLLLFSEYWKHASRFPLADDNLVAVGYPFIERMVRLYGKQKKDNALSILVISQKSFGVILSKLAIAIAKLLEREKKSYEIVYKLHPIECQSWRDDLSALCEQNYNITVVDNSSRSIYDFYAMCNYQIGVNSTALFEGLAFNMKTYVLKIPGWEKMKKLCDEKYMCAITSAEDFYHHIGEETLAEGSFWEHDSISKILREIEDGIR